MAIFLPFFAHVSTICFKRYILDANVAIIILSVIFERYLRCPLAVAGIFFSIGLVVTFALGAMIEYIVATIVYTILSFVAALITNYIRLNFILFLKHTYRLFTYTKQTI